MPNEKFRYLRIEIAGAVWVFGIPIKKRHKFACRILKDLLDFLRSAIVAEVHRLFVYSPEFSLTVIEETMKTLLDIVKTFPTERRTHGMSKLAARCSTDTSYAS